MKNVFFYIAIVCWFIVLMVHLLSVANVDVKASFPYVWALHVGIFVVWIPAVFELIKRQKQSPIDTGDVSSFFKMILRILPLG